VGSESEELALVSLTGGSIYVSMRRFGGVVLVQVVMIMLTELIEERNLAIVERDNYTVALVPMG
jgi:hypothetical protein